ncbi:MAG: class I SAM-dependent methyltransferase, partial [Steroidobacteraceae bacterium]
MTATSRRFESTVPYYARYRLGYPDRLIERVIALVGLQRGDAVLDLGSGPGLLAIPFAAAGLRVTAADPEPVMLEAAREAARNAGVALELWQGGSGDLTPAMGPYRLVTMGRSFHWMDRAAT